MQELGLAIPFWLTVGIWIARIVVLVFICILLALAGIRALDAATPHIHERQRIGEHPIATGLFIAGFFILIGLVIHGAATARTAIGTSIVWYIFDFRTWGSWRMVMACRSTTQKTLSYLSCEAAQCLIAAR